MFEEMSQSELRAYIDGCHANQEYGSDFEAACRTFNDRYRGVALTSAQFSALQCYARRHGRYWKSRLHDDWATGRDAQEEGGAFLRQIRNTLGPAWLSGYRLTEVTA